jgi:hypothetical protein
MGWDLDTLFQSELADHHRLSCDQGAAKEAWNHLYGLCVFISVDHRIFFPGLVL